MVSPSSLIYEMKGVYKRMLDEAEDEDERALVPFFMGCLYATHVAYEKIIEWEVEQEDEE